MMKEGLDTWICRTCFTSNKEDDVYCKTCGKQRQQIKKIKRAANGYIRPPEDLHERLEE
jgi:hypothetical protein